MSKKTMHGHSHEDKKGFSGSVNKCLLKTLLIANVLEAILIFVGFVYIVVQLVQGQTQDYIEAL